MGGEVATWFPPIVLPSGEGGAYASFEHLDRVVDAWSRIHAGVVLHRVIRIDLSRGEVLYVSANGTACLLLVPTDKHPDRDPEVIIGWPV